MSPNNEQNGGNSGSGGLASAQDETEILDFISDNIRCTVRFAGYVIIKY